MNRRRFLKSSVVAPLMLGLAAGRAGAQGSTMWDDSPEGRKWHAESLAAFPFEHFEVTGRQALQEWERLKAAGSGVPVVVGDDEAFTRVIEAFHPDAWQHAPEPVLAETLAKASRLRHPDDLVALRRAEGDFLPAGVDAETFADLDLEKLPEEQRDDADLMYETNHPPLGAWPASPPPRDSDPILTVAVDLRSGQPYEKVHIVIVPTDDPATIPAYLRWGGWNANPPAEYHVAALRSWRDRYGVELVGLGLDTMNLRAARRPPTREAALALAREQYTLCFDIIQQGYGSLSDLGAALMSNDWWFLWWD